MENELSLSEMKKEWHGSLKSYAIGFITSLILTSLSFSLVVFNLLSGNHLLYAIVFLALTQAVFQLIFFLHVGQEAKPKWETAIFFLMFIILLIIAIGSLWIMYDLNARMMPDMAEIMAK